MNTSTHEPTAKKVTFENDTMWVELFDGRVLGIPLAYFPRLLNASTEQRQKYTFSGGGTGIHWDDIDEDISVKGLLMGVGDQTLVATQTSLEESQSL